MSGRRRERDKLEENPTTSSVLPNSRFVLKLNQAGSGRFAKVYYAFLKNQQMVMKTPIRYNKSNPRYAEVLRREANLLTRMNHPNIIQFFGAYFGNRKFILIERCQSKSLRKLLNSIPYVTISTVCSWGNEIASAMQYLHGMKPAIIHGDLKADNILLKEIPCECPELQSCQSKRQICSKCNKAILKNLTLKITDFGAAREGDKQNDVTSGTFAWMAPEYFTNHQPTEETDVWGFGVVLWEIITQDIPYFNFQSSEIELFVIEKGSCLPCENFHASIKFMLKNCWKINPSHRSDFKTIQEILIESKANFKIEDIIEYDKNNGRKELREKFEAFIEELQTPKPTESINEEINLTQHLNSLMEKWLNHIQEKFGQENLKNILRRNKMLEKRKNQFITKSKSMCYLWKYGYTHELHETSPSFKDYPKFKRKLYKCNVN